MSQIQLTDEQGAALRELLGDHLPSGEGVLLTDQGASIYVAFTLASFSIDADGNVEDAG